MTEEGHPRIMYSIFFQVLVSIWRAVFVLWSWMKPRRHLTPPTYPGAWPIIGHAHLLLTNATDMWTLEKTVYDYCVQNDDVFELRLGPYYFYVITDPDDSVTVANKCMDKPYFYGFAKEMYGNGLITANGPVWKPHRKLLNPAFNQQVLQTFVEEFVIVAKSLVAQLSSEVGKGPFDVQPYLINSVMSIACRTTLGLKSEENNKTLMNYAHAAEDLFMLYLNRLQRVWLHVPYIFKLSSYKKKEEDLMKIMKEISKEMITNRKLTYTVISGKMKETTSEKFTPLLDRMLYINDKQDAFTEEEIREHLDTIIGAAYDTTATTLTFALLLIGSHQNVQDRIYKELQDVLGNEKRSLNRHDLPKLVYMEAVIKETLRLYPPVPRIARCASKEVELKKYVLPANCIYLIPLYSLNRHPSWGADAYQFRPERWLDPATLPDNPNVFASFSLGRRNCIGKLYGMMTVKITLAYILKQYRIESDIRDLVTRCDLLLKPVAGHEIRIESRP